MRQVIEGDCGYFEWLLLNTHHVFTEEATAYGQQCSKLRKSEYEMMLDICKQANLSSPFDLSIFISRKKLGERFPKLAGDLEFSDGKSLHNGISPDIYSQLCSDLGYDRPSTQKYVVRFTPNGEKHSN